MNNKTDSFDAAFDTAVRIIARRNHTRYEIARKLRQRNFTAAVIEAVIAECERRHYLDDDEAARCYFRELVRKGFGTERIRFEMKKKGLFGERVDGLIAIYDGSPDETAAAERLLVRRMARFEREADPARRKQKIFRFMYSRGFSADIIQSLIDNIINADE